jgi:glutamate carboxypeptidase
MSQFEPQLEWIESQCSRMVSNIERWCAINSGTQNRVGIETLADEVLAAFAPLAAESERVHLPSHASVSDAGEPTCFETAPAIVLRKRPAAARQVLLAIHLDTVYPATSDFQSTGLRSPRVLGGPGVADAKGGIALLGVALEALERSAAAEHLGWTVILNPDEEIGSPCSMGLLAKAAPRADFGLVFEPSLPDGSMISRRKGSGNFALVVRGRAAHVGRAFAAGRHAIHALADLLHELAGWNDVLPGVIANTGVIRGGGALNVVPDFALARVNLRVDDADGQSEVTRRLTELCRRIERVHEVEIVLHGAFLSPPKPVDASMEALMRELEKSGKDVGVEFGWQESGGVCDGNKLAAAGLPTIDTMGPAGGDIHSEREYLLLDSLVPRTRLCASLLYRYTIGDFEMGTRDMKASARADTLRSPGRLLPEEEPRP